jgi:hypothetical protein
MGNTGGKVKNELLNQLRAVVGDGTELPLGYLTSSRENRAQFLAGLLDTDGTPNNGGFEIVQKVRGFADGVCFLARSLGLRATLREKLVNGASYWRVIISGECSKLPLRIARKRPAPRQQVKRVNRTVFTIEPCGTGEYAGFELDGDGRFLLGDFTVTHNTSSAAAIGDALDLPVYCVDLTQLMSGIMHVTAQNLGALFAELEPETIVVFDEIDAIGKTRGAGDSGAEPSSEQKRALAETISLRHGVSVPDVDELSNFDAVTKFCRTHARRVVMAEIRAAERDGGSNGKREEEKDQQEKDEQQEVA